MNSLSDDYKKLAGTQLSKWRWALGLKGLASVAVGVMILAWPGISVYALTIVFGAFALASGIVELGSSFQAQSKQERITLILSGLLGIAVGVVVFAWPSISALALLYVIGVYALLLGFLGIAASLYLPVDGKTTSLMILTGIVSILFGIVIFAKPGTGALAVLALIAAFALITGFSQLAIALGGEKMLENWTEKHRAPQSRTPRQKPTPQASH
ncbi:MAG TPA: HdeD family acid-resistance protein [Gaiellaceae bacterium]|nr:HdeD family acid-resistance protein [Gaiellaceae bacterium]